MKQSNLKTFFKKKVRQNKLIDVYIQWRNVAPVAPASPGGAMRRGRQNVELKLFGCKNVPYVGQINVRWRGKIICGYKKLQGAPKSFRGRQKSPGGGRSL